MPLNQQQELLSPSPSLPPALPKPTTIPPKFDPPQNFIAAYLQRLHLAAPSVDKDEPQPPSPPPTLETLRAITRAHLETIPFENLDQHGCSFAGKCPTLDVNLTREKVLHHSRGGVCYELNLLLAELLEALGFAVRRMPAVIYIGPGKPYTEPDGYRPFSTHVFLLVQPPQGAEAEKKTWYLVDVGDGESPMEPLLYEYGTEQVTLGGMKCRIVATPGGGDEGGDNQERELTREEDGKLRTNFLSKAKLQWWVMDSNNKVVSVDHETMGSWVTLFKWNVADQFQTTPFWSTFQRGLDFVLQPDSKFSQKLLACRLTPQRKHTLAGGATYKVTGPPRFFDPHDKVLPPVVEHALHHDTTGVRECLSHEFGIPLEETVGLNLSSSQAAPREIWQSK